MLLQTYFFLSCCCVTSEKRQRGFIIWLVGWFCTCVWEEVRTVLSVVYVQESVGHEHTESRDGWDGLPLLFLTLLL